LLWSASKPLSFSVLIINYRPCIVKRKAGKVAPTDICTDTFPPLHPGFDMSSDEAWKKTGCPESYPFSVVLNVSREDQAFPTSPFVVVRILSRQVLIYTRMGGKEELMLITSEASPFQFNQCALRQQKTEQRFPEDRERTNNSLYTRVVNSSRLFKVSA